MSDIDLTIQERSSGLCELCKSGDGVSVLHVEPVTNIEANRSVLICGVLLRSGSRCGIGCEALVRFE